MKVSTATSCFSDSASRKSLTPHSFAPLPLVPVNIATSSLFNSILPSIYPLHSRTSFRICSLPLVVSNLSPVMYKPSYRMLPTMRGVFRMRRAKSDGVPIPLHQMSSTYSSLPHPKILRLRIVVVTSPRGGKTDDERMVDA